MNVDINRFFYSFVIGSLIIVVLFMGIKSVQIYSFISKTFNEQQLEIIVFSSMFLIMALICFIGARE